MSQLEDFGSRLRVVANLGRDSNPRKLVLSYVGYKLTELASWIVILVFAYDRGGVLESGIAAAVMLLPASLIVPFASAMGDRYSRVRVLAASYSLMAIASTACSAALVLGLSDLIVYASMLVLCTGISFSQPLHMSTLVSLADDAEALTAANVVNGMIESASYFAGPLLAALLLPWAGSWAVFAVLAWTMALSTVLALSMEMGDRGGESTPRLGAAAIWHDFGLSIRWALGESDGALLIGLMAGHEFLIGAIDVFFVAIAFDLLGTGDSGAALLNSAFGLGLIGGALLSVSLVGSRRMGVWLVLGGALTGIPLVLLSGISIEPAALILLGLAGVGALLTNVATRTLFQRVIPPHRITQSFGVLESIDLIALTLGMLGTAGLVERLGVAHGLVILGLFLSVAALLVYAPIRRLESKYGPPPARALEALLGLSIFRPLGVLAIDQLARAANFVEAERGHVLIRQGDEGGPFFVLLEGSVEARVDGVTVRTQGPGEFFGEISALHEIPRTATVVATTPVVVLELEPDLFVQAVSSHPGSLVLARGVAMERKLRRNTEA